MERPVPSSLIRRVSPPPSKRRKTSELPRPNGNGTGRGNHHSLGQSPLPSSKLSNSTPSTPPSDTVNSHSISKTSSSTQTNAATGPLSRPEPTLAAVEAGQAKIEDHLAYFTKHLTLACRPTPPSVPRLPVPSFASLYAENQHAHGHHFVIHQHNHPQAGVHYDLRLQFSATSSVSFAIPKGLPGDANSRSKGRMAIETRVHNYWNHLIESASWKSGSLLIWDTGTYEVLPRKMSTAQTQQTTDEEGTSSAASEAEIDGIEALRRTSSVSGSKTAKHENDKLIHAFQTRYIRLRLHGTRLPKNYTITLRLPSNNDFGNPHKTTHLQKHRRRRRYVPPAPQPQQQQQQGKKRKSAPQPSINSHSSSSDAGEDGIQETDFAPTPRDSDNANEGAEEEEEDANLDTDTSSEDLNTRLHNAYPGSTNSIGSVHQRKWFLMLDRRSSGFVAGTGTGAGAATWRRDGNAGFDPFYVRGRDVERSVVTGRLARDVEEDEGVEGIHGSGIFPESPARSLRHPGNGRESWAVECCQSFNGPLKEDADASNDAQKAFHLPIAIPPRHTRARARRGNRSFPRRSKHARFSSGSSRCPAGRRSCDGGRRGTAAAWANDNDSLTFRRASLNHHDGRPHRRREAWRQRDGGGIVDDNRGRRRLSIWLGARLRRIGDVRDDVVEQLIRSARRDLRDCRNLSMVLWGWDHWWICVIIARVWVWL
ncbi:uncharacterized protein EI97DRAFT_504796 [Westerdykella ornata]|uniref:DNA ligase D 3'-phosphoesterase domain-containing protein n=1 Tax=Westerdykella ornata TaxID=318751 RepID=A0A6A6J6Q0_WESOR|nr:uncharacterized protein EI97DRAFT_504796 [Westerdykella ornata]KAF2271648.1 hypothetical protein EI97DRAFT_504796 [Westerdykella ornata]